MFFILYTEKKSFYFIKFKYFFFPHYIRLVSIKISLKLLILLLKVIADMCIYFTIKLKCIINENLCQQNFIGTLVIMAEFTIIMIKITIIFLNIIFLLKFKIN
jgi:hypothetical protein